MFRLTALARSLVFDDSLYSEPCAMHKSRRFSEAYHAFCTTTLRCVCSLRKLSAFRFVRPLCFLSAPPRLRVNSFPNVHGESRDFFFVCAVGVVTLIIRGRKFLW